MNTAPEIAAHLEALERQLLDPTFRKASDEVARLLEAGFREFGSSGRIFGREQILAALAVETAAMTLALTDFACDLLAPDVALVTYRSHRQDGAEQAHSALRSSVWVRQSDGSWRLRFHQGTRQT